MDKSFKTRIAVLAWYQICGGALGIILTFVLYAGLFADHDHHRIAISMLVTIPALLFYGYSILCGRALLRGQVHRGLLLSTVSQTIQAVSVSTTGVGFKFVSGILIGFSIHVRQVLFDINLGLSSFTLRISPELQEMQIGLNFVALMLIYVIARMYHQAGSMQQPKDHQ